MKNDTDVLNAKEAAAYLKAHGRDISLFDETFLVKSLDKRLAATSTDTVAAYPGRCRHCQRDERRPGADPRPWIRRLHLQAD